MGLCSGNSHMVIKVEKKLIKWFKTEERCLINSLPLPTAHRIIYNDAMETQLVFGMNAAAIPAIPPVPSPTLNTLY